MPLLNLGYVWKKQNFETMNNAQALKRKLKQLHDQITEDQSIRLHRAISWLKCAEEQSAHADLQFISLWISFNACYANDEKKATEATEKGLFNDFIQKLIVHDTEKRFFKLLWEKFSGPVRLLIENEYVFKPFWDFQRGEIKNWKRMHEESVVAANKHLAKQDVPKMLEVVLDRLYTLRNQMIHGGATCKSKVNRSQLRDAINILKLIVPLIIEIMIENSHEDWGKIHYPVVSA